MSTNRKPFVGGNWKMNTDLQTGSDLVRAVADALDDADGVDVVVCPPFPYLLAIGTILRERQSGVMLGAQDISDREDGAFTGEVSASMLRDCGVSVVLTGHSERRHVIGETDELVGAKTAAALAAGLDVILCVGETIGQRESGETDAVNERQLAAGLSGIGAADMARVTIAYEPVWAIGTGKTATPEDAQDAHLNIRRVLATLYDASVAGATRIQYGGSVKPANATDLFARDDIDGGLIGGASLKAPDFAQIVRAAVPAAV